MIGFTDSSDFPTTPGAYDRTHEPGSEFDAYDTFATRLRLGPVLEFEGLPLKDAKTYYTIAGAHSDTTGFTAQVVVSCSGSDPGTRLPGGLILPIMADGCTTIGLRFGSLLQTVINAQGAGATPAIPFPSVPIGITVTSAAFLWDPATGKVHAITPPITITTL